MLYLQDMLLVNSTAATVNENGFVLDLGDDYDKYLQIKRSLVVLSFLLKVVPSKWNTAHL